MIVSHHRICSSYPPPRLPGKLFTDDRPWGCGKLRNMARGQATPAGQCSASRPVCHLGMDLVLFEANSACSLPPVLIGLRIFCRVQYGQKRLGGGLGTDDYLTLLCLAVICLSCILISVGSAHGIGRHYATLSAEEKVQAIKFNVVGNSILIWGFSLPKFAFISTLKRILNYGPRTTVLFWTLAITSQCCILATSVWWFEQCQPVAYAWDRTIEGKCASVTILADLGYFTSAYSAFLDLFFALYPSPLILRLNMPLSKRLAMTCALGLSVLGCIISIYKLAIFDQVFKIMATDPTCTLPIAPAPPLLTPTRLNKSRSRPLSGRPGSLRRLYPAGLRVPPLPGPVVPRGKGQARQRHPTIAEPSRRRQPAGHHPPVPSVRPSRLERLEEGEVGRPVRSFRHHTTQHRRYPACHRSEEDATAQPAPRRLSQNFKAANLYR